MLLKFYKKISYLLYLCRRLRTFLNLNGLIERFIRSNNKKLNALKHQTAKFYFFKLEYAALMIFSIDSAALVSRLGSDLNSDAI